MLITSKAHRGLRAPAALLALALLVGAGGVDDKPPQEGGSETADDFGDAPKSVLRARASFRTATDVAEAEFRPRYEALQESWREASNEHVFQVGVATTEFREELDRVANFAARDNESEEVRRVAEAKRILGGQDPLPLQPVAGRPGRGAKKFGGHQYLLVTKDLDWYAADADCRARGGRLVTIESREELSFVRGMLRGWAWIGASDRHVEGHWVWNTEAPVALEWPSGQPNNAMGSEHAAGLLPSGQLHDRNAFEQSDHVCEWGAEALWPFDFSTKRGQKALEKFERALATAEKTRDRAFARLRKESKTPLDTHSVVMRRAERDLLRAIEAAMVTEAKARHIAQVESLTDLKIRVAGGEFTPRVRPLGSPDPPDAAIEFRGRHFLFIDVQLPWRIAQEHCVRMGGELASVHDPKEQAFVASLFVGKAAQVWVGGCMGPRGGGFTWPDGAAIDAALWSKGQPDNRGGRESHTHLSEPGLGDGHQEVRYPFVCEWQY